jgi:hypothetical protein
MDDSLRSSDCYYRDRKPAVSLTAIPTPTYQQSSNLNSSNNKYYAEMPSPISEDAPLIAKLQLPPKKEVELEILDNCYGLAAIQAEFENGATLITVKATEYIITQLQIVVDMSVGRGELTRDQADSISFSILAPEAIKEEVVKVVESMPEAAAIINDEPKPSRKKAKRGKSDEITLKDIATAFGGDDSDD